MKKLLLSLVFMIVLMAAAPTPAHAADNWFQKIGHSITSGFQRVYLMLPGDKSGEVVFQQSLDASKNLKSTEMNANFTVDAMKDDSNLANVKLNISGPIQIQQVYDPSTYKQDLHVAGEFTMQGTTMKAAADVKMAGQVMYFKLTEVPALPYIDLTTLKDKWMKTEMKGKTATAPQTLTADQQAQIQAAYADLMKKAQLSSAKKETKNDHNVYVINVTIPKQAMMDYLDQVQKIYPTASGVAADPAVVQKAHDADQKFLDNVGDLKMTVWIDQSSFYVRHVEVPLVYTVEKTAEDMAAEQQATGPMAALATANKLNISIAADMDKFNEPINFQEPTDAQDLQTVLSQFMGPAMMRPSTGAGMMPSGYAPTGTNPYGPSMMQGAPGSAPSIPSVNPSELPNLTPQQKAQLLKYQQMQQQGQVVPPTGVGY